MSSANTGWIADDLTDRLLTETKVLKRADGYALIHHEMIPTEADHVTIADGRYVVVPNPSALKERSE